MISILYNQTSDLSMFLKNISVFLSGVYLETEVNYERKQL